MNENFQINNPNWTSASEGAYKNPSQFGTIRHDNQIFEFVQFWIGGVATCLIAIPGFVMNIVAIYYLVIYPSGKSIFNRLIMCLFAFDAIYLVPKILGIFIVKSGLLSIDQARIGGNVTFPLMHISLTASIFLTVGIAHERYIAIVKNPIVHRTSMESAVFRRNHFRRYIVCITFFAVLFNIPLFFEKHFSRMDLSTSSINSTLGKRYLSREKLMHKLS